MGLLHANNHLAVLDDNDWVALVLVLGVNGGSGLGVGGLLLHHDLRRPMQRGVVLGVYEPLVFETIATHS